MCTLFPAEGAVTRRPYRPPCKSSSTPILPMTSQVASPRWQPLPGVERRVLGVLIEKAKTTPDNYPLTLVAACNGCNQKSNRDPQMNLHDEDVQTALDRLRERGVVVLVEGSGRVEKYRHLAYEWFGVNRAELAVMCELLLRGPQTEGQLRGHVHRMEPMADLAALRHILAGLKARGLVLPLTPEGRGHVVAHGLYPAEELAQIRAHYRTLADTTAAGLPSSGATTPAARANVASHQASLREQVQGASIHDLAELENRVASLQAEVTELRAAWQRCQAAIERLCGTLGVDLPWSGAGSAGTERA